MFIFLKVGTIVHAGADVKLDASFERLEGPNVGGTRSALELAGSCFLASPLVDASSKSDGRRWPCFVHVSTNGIFPARSTAKEQWKDDTDTRALPDRLKGSDG